MNPTNQALDAKPFLEGVEQHVVPRSGATSCPVGPIPVYRAFREGHRATSTMGNHRFSVSLAQHQDMVNRPGWTDEGVVFCGLQ